MLASHKTSLERQQETISGAMSGYGFTPAGTTYDFEDRLTAHARNSSTSSQSWSLTSVGDWSSVTTNGTAQSRTHDNTHSNLPGHSEERCSSSRHADQNFVIDAIIDAMIAGAANIRLFWRLKLLSLSATR